MVFALRPSVYTINPHARRYTHITNSSLLLRILLNIYKTKSTHVTFSELYWVYVSTLLTHMFYVFCYMYTNVPIIITFIHSYNKYKIFNYVCILYDTLDTCMHFPFNIYIITTQ